MVTAEHVAAAMKLSGHDWKRLEILENDSKLAVDVRIIHTVGISAEKIAVLELRAPYSNAQQLPVRMQPLAAEERVLSLAYPDNRLRFAAGRFVRYADSGKIGGNALLEMSDGNDRLALDHGASGAPILDCDGRVVAVVSNVFTQTMQFQSRPIRISTAWGQPNVVSVPIHALKDHVPVE